MLKTTNMRSFQFCCLLAFAAVAKSEQIVEVLIKTADNLGDGMNPDDGTGETGQITLQVIIVQY